MLALTWLVYACFGIVGGSLPPLVGSVTGDLALSSTQMGLVLGAWQLMYIGTATPLGALVDRFGARRSPPALCLAPQVDGPPAESGAGEEP